MSRSLPDLRRLWAKALPASGCVAHLQPGRAVLHRNGTAPIVFATKPGSKGTESHEHLQQLLEAARPPSNASTSRGLRVSVVLSSHFVHLQLLPWRQGLRSDAEWIALARHAWTAVHGSVVQSWGICVSESTPGQPRVACGIDGRLVESLRDACAIAGARLESVTPHFMKAFNAVRHQLGRNQAWFADVEPGRAVIGLVRDGEWLSLRSRRLTNDEGMGFDAALAREAALNGANDVRRIALSAQEGTTAPTLPDGFELIKTVGRQTGAPWWVRTAGARVGLIKGSAGSRQP